MKLENGYSYSVLSRGLFFLVLSMLVVSAPLRLTTHGWNLNTALADDDDDDDSSAGPSAAGPAAADNAYSGGQSMYGGYDSNAPATAAPAAAQDPAAQAQQQAPQGQQQASQTAAVGQVTNNADTAVSAMAKGPTGMGSAAAQGQTVGAAGPAGMGSAAAQGQTMGATAPAAMGSAAAQSQTTQDPNISSYDTPEHFSFNDQVTAQNMVNGMMTTNPATGDKSVTALGGIGISAPAGPDGETASLADITRAYDGISNQFASDPAEAANLALNGTQVEIAAPGQPVSSLTDVCGGGNCSNSPFANTALGFTNTVTNALGVTAGFDPGTLAHELGHEEANQEVASDPGLQAQFNAAFQAAVNNSQYAYGTLQSYAITNEAEYMAEAFRNSTLQSTYSQNSFYSGQISGPESMQSIDPAGYAAVQATRGKYK